MKKTRQKYRVTNNRYYKLIRGKYVRIKKPKGRANVYDSKRQKVIVINVSKKARVHFTQEVIHNQWGDRIRIDVFRDPKGFGKQELKKVKIKGVKYSVKFTDFDLAREEIFKLASTVPIVSDMLSIVIVFEHIMEDGTIVNDLTSTIRVDDFEKLYDDLDDTLYRFSARMSAKYGYKSTKIIEFQLIQVLEKFPKQIRSKHIAKGRKKLRGRGPK